ncbi:ulp1 protease family, C-terminal catalytic domain-containing protein [Tanacetum coccineum]
MIEEKISVISAEKIALEDLLKRANAEFQNDEKVIELYEKYRRLFKQSVFLEDFQADIDDFDNNDDDRGGKNDDHGSDNVGKKKESAAKDVGKKDGVNAEKDGVNAVQEGEAHEDLFVWPRAVQPLSAVCPQRVVTRSSPKKSIVKPPSYLNSPYMNKRTKVIPLIKRLEFVLGNSLFAMQGDKYETVFQASSGHDVSSVRVNMETLAPRLWIDSNVIDCWVAILNHEELVKGCPSPRRHFFPTGCITKAIIEGTIDEEHQWKVFSDEISEQFKHDVSSISLSEVDLEFFPIYASGHFYVVVFHLKSPSTMIILDNSDCGETYNSKYKAVCGPLVLMLRRMRFKIAAKILLNEFNIYSEKMFDLALKFETENDEQKRIPIIVNAIKNRNERDPAKKK